MRHGMSCSEAGKLGVPKTIEITLKKKKDRINKYNLNPSRCIECDTQMLYEQRHDRFCSQSCAAINNNKKRIQKIKYKCCLFCKKEFVFSVKNSRVKFCSLKCYELYIKYKRKLLVENGKASHKVLKKYILDVNGHKCSNCGLTTWQHVPIPLVLDHKDGNHKNNTIKNCRLLCNNCDALTPTYKGRNKGNGRYYRRLRYSQGKSF